MSYCQNKQRVKFQIVKMYHLLSGFYKYLFQLDEYYVLILGLDNAGKSTYLEAAKTHFTKNYKALNPNKITSTVGLNIGVIETDGCSLNFWDLGGQEELQSLWDKYYAESHAVIYVVDAFARDRIEESKAVFDKMIASELLKGIPLLVLANKQDLQDSMGVREVKPIFNQNAHLIGQRDCMVMPVSALNGDGVDEGIKWLVQCVKRNNVVRPPRNQSDN
ncbi:ADP-ribosylation factor-related protein 1-like [Daphnia carinata]|uniref:ADP-ribosylation factor-related protein 1-like n=1 Tax=Daphnia carinata TaxID=120202 RepID=UPI00257CE29F|nr:ADP-ribosylation factor-related protein 1-like [Daphnia carinata]